MKTTLQHKSVGRQLAAIFTIAAFLLIHGTAFCQESTTDIAKKLSNPVASLISVPLEDNYLTGVGPLKGYQNTLDIEPVIPFTFTKNWNLITRVVLPVVTQTNVSALPGRQSGLSDAVVSAFLSPSKTSGGLIWGAGPAFLIPTATNNYLATKKWGVGPTAAVLYQQAGWTYGMLVNQIWSYAGSNNRDNVSQFYALPFITYNFPTGAGLSMTGDVTRDWKHHYTDAVVTPAVSGLTRIGKQVFQLQAGPMIPISAAPGEKPDFGVRTKITFVFPRK
ncbi:MAG TPA: hypothetical protein VGM41_01635 [Chitinophagaceae bacterium]|jgi:hypothetical protein